jgi:hypothetical protein
LIGAIYHGHSFELSINLLKSFQVPIITTFEVNTQPEPGTLFSVSSSLKYLSNGIVQFLKKLNWSSATLVISDNVPSYYSEMLDTIGMQVFVNVDQQNYSHRFSKQLAESFQSKPSSVSQSLHVPFDFEAESKKREQDLQRKLMSFIKKLVKPE